MSSARSLMESHLKSLVVPALRTTGFKGSLPHFRRLGPERIDLIAIQFDRSGGGLFVRLSQCGTQGTTTRQGEAIEPRAVRVSDMAYDEILWLQPPADTDAETWLRFDSGQFAHCARQVLACLPRAEAWWRSKSETAPSGTSIDSRRPA